MTKKKDDHKFGKHTGYTLMPDGSIRIAPTYVSQFADNHNERIALDILVRSFTAQCHELARNIAKRERALWDCILDDYGIEKGSNYAYGGNSETIFLKADAEQPSG